MERLLLLEDDLALGEGVRLALQSPERPVTLCRDLTQARQTLAEDGPFALAILDVNLPDGSGLSLLEELRGRVPVILLTARGTEMDKVVGLDTGADDYVVKPYRPAALLARIDRALARSGSADSARRQLERDGVLLDPVRAEVSYRGKTVELSRNELLILRILMENAGSIISRSELMDELWQTDAFVDDNTLTVNVNRLRRSLQSAGIPDDFITTRRGLGYVVR